MNKEQLEERFEMILPDRVIVAKNPLYGVVYYIDKQCLYNAGYRKIDNDRYFDRKEYAKFFRTALEGCAEENIKSTAKEILNYLIECDVNEIGKGMIVVTYGTIEKLIEKYGVEIEE